MQITFDTTTITDDEVRGIFALLDTVRPAAFDPGSEMERLVEEKLSGPVKLAEETVEDHLAEVAAIPETDSTGLVWDERIHASSKALNADGTWRTKRGVDKALVAQVEAELRQTYISGLDAANERVAGLAGVEDAQTVAPPAPPTPPAPEAPTAPLAPAVTESAPVAPSSAVSPFVALMKRVTTAQGAGKLTAQRVKELLEGLDKKSIMDLRTDTDALDAFAVLLDGEGV